MQIIKKIIRGVVNLISLSVLLPAAAFIWIASAISGMVKWAFDEASYYDNAL